MTRKYTYYIWSCPPGGPVQDPQVTVHHTPLLYRAVLEYLNNARKECGVSPGCPVQVEDGHVIVELSPLPRRWLYVIATTTSGGQRALKKYVNEQAAKHRGVPAT